MNTSLLDEVPPHLAGTYIYVTTSPSLGSDVLCVHAKMASILSTEMRGPFHQIEGVWPMLTADERRRVLTFSLIEKGGAGIMELGGYKGWWWDDGEIWVPVGGIVKRYNRYKTNSKPEE